MDHRVFDPVDVPSTYRETIARLGVAIRIGVLGPGARLPPERELAERLAISRSTLRQALASLTQTGYLVAVRGRSGGTFVAAAPPLTSPVPFPLEQARSLLDWRMALELGTVQLAAERTSPERIRQLAAAAEQMADTDVIDDWTRFRRADAAFHVGVAEATGAERLVAATTQVQGELCDLFHAIVPPRTAGRRSTAVQHLAVVAAIAGGDPVAACAAMHAHLTATERLVDQLSTSAA